MACGTRIHSGLLAHVGPEVRYGAENNIGLSLLFPWRKVLSGAPLTLPALFRHLWHPTSSESHSTYALESSFAEPELPKRDIVRACAARYEHFVSSTVLSPASTTAHAMSAVLQYEELQGLFQKYPSLQSGLLSRGLAVAVKSCLQAKGGPSSLESIAAAEDILFEALSQYTKSGEGGASSPVFDVALCRHSVSTVVNALIRLDPDHACALFTALEPLITTSEDSKVGYISMGSSLASAAVTASIRGQCTVLRDHTVNIRRSTELFRERFSFNFKSLLTIARQLCGREALSPQLYQELASAAVAFDLGRWQKRNGYTRSLTMPAPQELRHGPLDAPVTKATNSPVHFIACDSKRALKSLRKSQAHHLPKPRQLLKPLHACQVLSLTQTATDVRHLAYSIMCMGRNEWETVSWVDGANHEVLCAILDRLVQHRSWKIAWHVAHAALVGSELAQGEVKVDTRELSSVFEQPDQMVNFLCDHNVGDFQAASACKRSHVMNVMLQSILSVAFRQHSKGHAPLPIQHVVRALALIKEHNCTLSKHMCRQLVLASAAINRGEITDLQSALARDHAVQLLGWRTVFQSLILAGDDGSAILDICNRMEVEELVSGTQCSELAVVAASYSMMRATGVALPDRLFKVMQLLSRLSSAQLEGEELPSQISRALTSGFFQHPHWLTDVCSHGLLQMCSLLLSAGLPFGRHLQLRLARRKYEAACGLLQLGVPGADDVVHKYGLERLLIADKAFARGPAGRKCIARLAAADEEEVDALSSGMLDLIPYLSDGYVVSVGHATQPMQVKEMTKIAQSLLSQPRGGKYDLSACLSQDVASDAVDQIAPLLHNYRAGRVHAPDWLQMNHKPGRGNKPGDDSNNIAWQPEHFAKLGVFPGPLHTDVHGFRDVHKLICAIEQFLSVQRMIQAVPPE